MSVLGNSVGQFGAWWNQANATQRALVVGGAGAAALSVGMVLFWTSQPDYVVLFSGLDPETAGQILEELDEGSVPYRVSSSGGTVHVPADRVGELRMRVAGKGLTGDGTVGYEIFDKQSLGMTEFLQHVNYRRALEGELTRTIVALDEVENARVHLAIPDKSPFQRNQQETTASVILDLKPGARLRDEQVRGIYALMAASVDGLDAGGVTVVDDTGRELGGGGTSGEFAATTEQLRIQQDVENYLRQKATSMLEQVVGMGEVMVQVNAELDFERVERSVESFNPNTASIRSEQRVTGEEAGEESPEKTLTSYELDKTVENILESVGTVDRISIAVLVNGTSAVNPDGTVAYQDRPTNELDTLAAVVRDAVGYDEDRGDSLEIASMRFATTGAEELGRSPMPWWLLFPSMGSLLRALVILTAIGLVGWGLRQSSRILVEAVEADRRRREKVIALEENESSEAEIRKEVIRDQMNTLAYERPNEVAQVLRSWLVEEKSS